MLRLQRVPWERCDWPRMDAFGDRYVFQARAWLEFIAEAHEAEPVIAAVTEGAQTVGYFTGLLTRRFGVRILGSPFPGWGTGYLGFNLQPGVSRRGAVEALLPFAWRALKCRHLELRDRFLAPRDLDGLGFSCTPKTTFELDLRRDEDAVFAGFAPARRRNVRKAERVGVVVEEAHDLGFADEYHAQLCEVFGRQRLAPPYGVERVRALIRHLLPTGQLLLLRARSPDGRCIATSITVGLNRATYFWGGASWRAEQIMRPNEALWWYAARFWKRRGIAVFDLGGGGEYKRKYGSTEVTVPFFRVSRSPVVAGLRDAAQRGHELRQRAVGRVSGRTYSRPHTGLAGRGAGT